MKDIIMKCKLWKKRISKCLIKLKNIMKKNCRGKRIIQNKKEKDNSINQQKPKTLKYF